MGTRFSATFQTGPGAHSASYTVGTGSLSPGVKWPGHGVDHPPPSSAAIKEREELYLCSPSGPSWPVLGRTEPFYWWDPLSWAYCQEVHPGILYWHSSVACGHQFLDWNLHCCVVGRKNWFMVFDLLIFMLLSFAHELSISREWVIVFSSVLCCLLLFFADAQITSTNMPTFMSSIFFKCWGRSLMYTLNNVVLEAAPYGRPIFDCLYFDFAPSHRTLTHLCVRNLPNQLIVFPLTPYIFS